MTPTKGKVTPGPWVAKFGENDGYDCMTAAWTITGADKRVVAVVDYENWNAEHFDSTRIPEADANARLISSAPSLLEAAQSAYLALLRSGAYRIRVQPELIALRNAIAAALGLTEQEVQDNAESMVAYE